MGPLVQQLLSLSQLLRQVSPEAVASGEGPAGAVSGRSSQASGEGWAGFYPDLPPALIADVGRQVLAEQEWLGGIAALAHLLVQRISTQCNPDLDSTSSLLGVALSGPFPVLPDRILDRRLSNWLLLPAVLDGMLAVARPLLPANGKPPSPACDLHTVPLGDDDPLAQERFCLLLTTEFCLVLVLGHDPWEQPQFQFSFDPTLAERVWQQLRDRTAQSRPSLLPTLDQVVAQFPPVAPDFRLVTQYSHLLLQQMGQRSQALAQPPQLVQAAATAVPPRRTVEQGGQSSRASMMPQAVPRPLLLGGFNDGATAPDAGTDTELLKAMAHEIRTPLTTIRTFTRSLLKRQDISDAVARRLRMIDQECTQQIDRFNLIFRAVELETDHHRQPKSPLSAISLNQLFQDAIPLWQQQASRRNLTLEVEVPPHLPMVNSDPTMLNQVLTGLIDRFTHSLPPYSHIQLAVTLAGHQLKLQFQSQPSAVGNGKAMPENQDVLFSSPFKALGQLLMFQPETGGLSLNLNVTKNLFQALGGKLIVRQRPQTGEVLTVFLPLETRTL